MQLSPLTGDGQTRAHLAAKRTLLARGLGIAGILGSPMMFLIATPPSSIVNGMVWSLGVQLLYLGGWLCILLGLRLLCITGNGRGAQALFGVQLIALLLAVSFSLWEAFAPREHNSTSLLDFLYTATDMCWPLSHLLMLLAGITIVRAKVWRGWRTWPAFLVGLALPCALLARQLHNTLAMQVSGWAFGGLTLLGFAGLGIALLSSHLRPAFEAELLLQEA